MHLDFLLMNSVTSQGEDVSCWLTGGVQAHQPSYHRITPSGFQSESLRDFTAGRHEILGANPPIRAAWGSLAR